VSVVKITSALTPISGTRPAAPSSLLAILTIGDVWPGAQ
jgi:hypothetical protein